MNYKKGDMALPGRTEEYQEDSLFPVLNLIP